MSITTISNCGCCGGSQSQSEEGCGDCCCKWIWSMSLSDWVLDGDNSTCQSSTSCEGRCSETTKPRDGIHYEGASLEDGTIIETFCCEDRPDCDSSLQCKFRWDEEVTGWELLQEESCDSNLPESSTAHTCCPDPPEPAFWPDLGFPPFANHGEIRVTPCQHPVDPQGGIGVATDCHCGCRENVFAEGS